MTAFQIKSIRLKGVHTYTSDVMFILREAWLTLKMKTDRLKGGSGGGGGRRGGADKLTLQQLRFHLIQLEQISNYSEAFLRMSAAARFMPVNQT